MFGRLFHHVHKALDNIRYSWGVNLLTIGTMSAALALVGLYAAAVTNFESLSRLWNRVSTVTVYLADELEPAAWDTTATLLSEFSTIEAARVITPERAMREFINMGEQARQMVRGVDARIFPPAIEISLVHSVEDAGSRAHIERMLQRVPGVERIDYGQQEHEQIAMVMQVLRYVGVAGGIIVALAIIFIVSNTIKLIVYARRDEIEVIQLVGGTSAFVRAPFLIEGVIWGLVSGLVAAVLLWLADASLAPSLSAALARYIWGFDLELFTWTIAQLLLGAGILLGLTGSAVAVGRFLQK